MGAGLGRTAQGMRLVVRMAWRLVVSGQHYSDACRAVAGPQPAEVDAIPDAGARVVASIPDYVTMVADGDRPKAAHALRLADTRDPEQNHQEHQSGPGPGASPFLHPMGEHLEQTPDRVPFRVFRVFVVPYLGIRADNSGLTRPNSFG